MTTTTVTTADVDRAIVEMTKAQIDRPNLAGNEEVHKRVLKYAQEACSEHSDAAAPLHQRWSITHHMLAGNTIDRAGPVDVHIPELYKMIETLVPRIEEIVLEMVDPNFRVRARREDAEALANANAALLDYQLDQMQDRRRVQPGLRDMLVHQVVVEKLWWDVRYEEVVTRTVEKSLGKGATKPTYKINRKREKRVRHVGPCSKLVDPYDFIIDPKATDAQDAAYVGDRCYMSYYQLLALQEQGFLTNVEKLKEQKPGGTLFQPEIDYYKWSRSPIDRSYSDRLIQERQQAGQPEIFEVVELWGRYDLRGNGEHVEAVITVVNGSVVVRAMENPFDFKQRPYAIGRCARNAHDFWGTGPLDNAVRLNQFLDRYHSIFLRTAEIAGNPMVFVEDDSEMPDSLWKVRPFSIFKAVGRVTMTDVPDGALSAGPLILTHLTRQIEETVGVYKIEMGQQFSTGTATEASLSLQEGNRRMRGLVRSYTDFQEQKLRLMHKLNLQFLTDQVAFRVIGKRAKHLGQSFLEFGPDMLLEEIDFEFMGLQQIGTYGQRATALERILSTAGPLIVQNANRVDQVGILHTLFEVLVGANEADRYVKPMTDIDTLMAQEEENVLLAQGVKIQVSKDDPHQKHARELKPLFDACMSGDIEGRPAHAIMEHYMQHLQFAAREEQQQAIRDREAQQRQAMLGPQAGGMQDGTQGLANQPPMAGGYENDLQQVGGQVQGESPGPTDPNKTGTSGRQSGSTLSQQQSQPMR